jgi:predicted nucleic acid-binding protein
MTTAVDTNVIIALWDLELRAVARGALEAAMEGGSAVIAAPVFGELMAGPGRDEAFVDSFLRDTGITVDWNLDEAVWRRAGRAFQGYTARRKQSGSAPRRILADFLIGAHALDRGYRLLTMDEGLYRSAFPALTLVEV